MWLRACHRMLKRCAVCVSKGGTVDKGFWYMIKCVACSCRRLVGGLQCLVEVHSLPASVLDLAASSHKSSSPSPRKWESWTTCNNNDLKKREVGWSPEELPKCSFGIHRSFRKFQLNSICLTNTRSCPLIWTIWLGVDFGLWCYCCCARTK